MNQLKYRSKDGKVRYLGTHELVDGQEDPAIAAELRAARKIRLGDRVERIAQPIAKAIDKVAGTNIQGCGACKKRKEWLNNLIT